MKKGPRKARKLPEVLTAEERERLLAQPNPKCKTGLRNLCMMKLMLDAGLRASEVLNLRPQDIDWMSWKLMVREGKGKKGSNSLDRRGGPGVIAGVEGEKAWGRILVITLQDGKLDDRYLLAMVKRLAKQAAITKGCSPTH